MWHWLSACTVLGCVDISIFYNSTLCQWYCSWGNHFISFECFIVFSILLMILWDKCSITCQFVMRCILWVMSVLATKWHTGRSFPLTFLSTLCVFYIITGIIVGIVPLIFLRVNNFFHEFRQTQVECSPTVVLIQPCLSLKRKKLQKTKQKAPRLADVASFVSFFKVHHSITMNSFVKTVPHGSVTWKQLLFSTFYIKR